ncbi:MAG: UBP-type zinc finger domain-containing protein [Cytophagaceae bacterium]|nr:UBP-type zinc finger domain-containing protein [Cytophagaceae bacterium]
MAGPRTHDPAGAAPRQVPTPLRTCQSCGVTLCCNSSPQKHATQHFQASGHPVMASAEPGERWVWCYVHETIAEY